MADTHSAGRVGSGASATPCADACVAPRWTRRWLIAAAAYHLAFGVFVLLFPAAVFEGAGVEPPRHPQLWQWAGILVGVYGVGYWIAASHPFRHWPVILVGLLGKILGPLGLVAAVLSGELPWNWGLIIIVNDVLWWVPLAAILYLAFRYHTNTELSSPLPPSVVSTFTSHRGATLRALSMRQPLMVVFLRHLGCTFCRETLSDLSQLRHELRAAGMELALVHPSAPMAATQLLSAYGLEDVHRFADPRCQLYREFQLQRGHFRQLFGLTVWMRAFRTLLAGHGLGALHGDGFRMPGVFILHQGVALAEFRHRTAADRPDYRALIRSAIGAAGGVPVESAQFAPSTTG